MSWRDLQRFGGLTSRKWINFERMTELAENATFQAVRSRAASVAHGALEEGTEDVPGLAMLTVPVLSLRIL